MLKIIGKPLFGLILLLLLCVSGVAQSGHNIEIDIENYSSSKLIFAHEFLNRYPVVDTLEVNSEGNFVHTSEEALPTGVYMAVLLPENEFVSFIIDTDDQHFMVKADAKNLYAPTQFVNSKYNPIYTDYVKFSNEQVNALNAYNIKLQEATDEATSNGLRSKFASKLKELTDQRQVFINKAPSSLAAQLIKMEIETPIPSFAGTEEDVLNQKYAFRIDHYFDHVDLTDERLLNSEAMFNKVFFYLNQLVPQSILSINASIDKVLGQMKPGSNNFKFFLDHIMLEYASSDFIGMDAVYVHVVDQYYAKGMAPWVKEEDLAEMLEDVRKRKPLLLGNPAPMIDMELQDGTPISLYDIDAPITLLYLWQPNCSHCKASTPYMKSFWDKYKSTGLKIFAGCTKVGAKTEDCWKYVEENGLQDWIHAVDKDLSSRFVQKYMAEKTPKLFILDADKKIILKDFNADQLEEILPALIETNRLSKPENIGKSE